MKEDKTPYIRQLEENQKEQESLKKQLETMQKGHVNILYRNGKGYYYLTHREGKKIKNDYLGPVGKADLSEVFSKLNERENVKRKIRRLKEEEKELKKLIGRRRRVAEAQH